MGSNFECTETTSFVLVKVYALWDSSWGSGGKDMKEYFYSFSCHFKEHVFTRTERCFLQSAMLQDV